MAFETVARLADLPVGSLRLARVGGRRLCLVRTTDGVFALDNACPHEGYGLTQGDLDGDELTCEWHNWRFRVTDGRCTLGEEDVVSHPVVIEGDEVRVELRRPDPVRLRADLTASLRRGIDSFFVGQISRDVVRLLRADEDPAQLIWEAVAWGAPRAEYGFGHALASATDCLALVERHEGDLRALPVVQAIAGIAEVERRRPLRAVPEPLAALPPRPGARFRELVEQGWDAAAEAEALLRAAIDAGLGPDELRPWLVGVVADHHLGYGHGAIYVQKAFEMLDRLGWDRAPTVLPHLVIAHLAMTREDRLPYMRGFVRALDGVDLPALAEAEPAAGWTDDGTLRAALLSGRAEVTVPAAVRAVHSGAGVEGLIGAVGDAVSRRLLSYDPAVERDHHEDFGWLDITHGLTYAAAARWAWSTTPGPDAARLALWTAFLAGYSGRRGFAPVSEPPLEADGTAAGLSAAVDDGRYDDAARAALAGDPAEVAAELVAAALDDRAGSFIVAAHAVKTTEAAITEHAATGSALPLAAVARFMAAPRRERFVAGNVMRSIDFLSGRGPAERTP
jgi:nitrite reductase/ring-hydroxylating ferredoxin subunit